MIMMYLIFMLSVPLETEQNDLMLLEEGIELQVIKRESYSLRDVDLLFINDTKLEALKEKINEKIYQKPLNATLDQNDKIIPEKPGVMLNYKKFIDLFYTYYYQGTLEKIEIPTEAIYPKVDSELLAEISVEKLGEYTTYFKESNEERSHNIALSVDAINNHVVFPGEEFSFNKVVGERTVEKGYKKAPVIVKGELSEDIGGGICQVSSTLFNAVSLKGIQMTERYSHSREVPYVPPGRDATVSWWGPDFAFINQYDSPILIRAFSQHGKLRISIFSSEMINVR